MIFSTLKKYALSLALVGFAAAPAQAEEVTQFTDLFGTYQFTADVSVIDETYADYFSTDCEVTIATHSIYAAQVQNFAGSPYNMMINGYDLDAHTFYSLNPNTSNYSLWADPLGIADADANYPYGADDSFTLTFTYDPSTGDITVPDFTAVTIDWENSTCTKVATFTNCKLTLKERTVIEIPDMTGEYAVTGYTVYDEESTSFLYENFTMTLTATSEDFTQYTANFYFDEGVETTISDVTFDGNLMTFNFSDNYLTADSTLAFIVNGGGLSGSFQMSYVSDNVLSIYSSIRVGLWSEYEVESVDETTGDTITTTTEGFRTTQRYYYGSAVKTVEQFDIEGTYIVKATPEVVIGEEGDYPSEFNLTIKYNANTDAYYVYEFVGSDEVYTTSMGSVKGVRTDNTLTIAAGDTKYLKMTYQSDDGMSYTYWTLGDGYGTQNGNLTLTFSEDGTVEVSDFSVFITDEVYDSSWNLTSTSQLACLYTTASAVSGIDTVKLAATEAGGEGVYTTSGIRVASDESQIDSLPSGLYIVRGAKGAKKVVK